MVITSALVRRQRERGVQYTQEDGRGVGGRRAWLFHLHHGSLLNPELSSIRPANRIRPSLRTSSRIDRVAGEHICSCRRPSYSNRVRVSSGRACQNGEGAHGVRISGRAPCGARETTSCASCAARLAHPHESRYGAARSCHWTCTCVLAAEQQRPAAEPELSEGRWPQWIPKHHADAEEGEEGSYEQEDDALAQ